MSVLCGIGFWQSWLRTNLVVVVLLTIAHTAFAQSRLPIPSVERQTVIAKLLEDTHEISKLKTVSNKQAKLKPLLEVARDKNLMADDRYVVLTTVISLAKDVSDFSTWKEAVDALVGAYEVDANKEKERLLTEFLEATKSLTPLKSATDAALAVAREAAQENRYVDANSLLKATDLAAQRVTGANVLSKSIAETREAIAAREKDWKAFQAASTKLGTNDDDSAANFTVGRWHVLQQADWKTALPFLAKVSDAKWKAAAELEQTAPLDATVQAAVGDKWWDIAQGLSEKGEGEAPAEPRTVARSMKTALLVHAGEWYARAQPNLTSVLQKELVTKRLNQIAPLKGAAPVKPAVL